MTAARLHRVRAAQQRSWVLRARQVDARLGLPQDDAHATACWRLTDARARVLGRPLTVEEAVAIIADVERCDVAEILVEARRIAAENPGGE